MKRVYWFLLIVSAVLYALPFLFSEHLWWLVFMFAVPLLYVVRTINLSFIHGYVWGCAVFAFHLSGGIYVITCMAHESWLLGVAIGVTVVMYQALFPAVLFWSVMHVVKKIHVQSGMIRLFMWTFSLWLFIMWTDWYSMCIFGI